MIEDNTVLDPITAAIAQVLEESRPDRSGELASYIPQLAHQNPELFGISMFTSTGRSYGCGDTQSPFTIQSVSKPFLFAAAISLFGLDKVSHTVDFEPSGSAFDSLSLNDEGMPKNAMINAGAIAITGLFLRELGGRAEAMSAIDKILNAFAGRTLAVDMQVFESERATGAKNRSLAWYMTSTGHLKSDVEETLEAYFLQCSYLVTADDVAVMSATLANAGINPLTGQRVVSETAATQTLTVMATCGMYDYAGEWLVNVGVPAKSGVSGVLTLASPGEAGMAMISPRIDKSGNSVRGIHAAEKLSEIFDWHIMHRQHLVSRVIGMPQIGSVKEPEIERGAVPRYPLHGDLDFAALEYVLHFFTEHVKELSHWNVEEIVIDLSQVTSVRPFAHSVFEYLAQHYAQSQVSLEISDPAELLD